MDCCDTRTPKLGPHEHPSTYDVLEKEGPDFTLRGKTVLVTGASSGIGVDTVRAFAAKGARVFAAVKDVEKCRKVLAEINDEFPENGGLEILKVEMSSLRSVNEAADDFLKRSSQLNILVNNAGVMWLTYDRTVDNHEFNFGVNHMAHFLLFKRLEKVLAQSSTPDFHSRVVCVSSGAHRWCGVDLTDLHWKKRGYQHRMAYAQSKTANILMAREIEKRYAGQGVHAWAVHPGFIMDTEVTRYMSKEDLITLGILNAKGGVEDTFRSKTLTQGAATTVWAAVSRELEGRGGLYLLNVKIGSLNVGSGRGGYSAHAYDEEMARQLWEYSEKAIQLVK